MQRDVRRRHGSDPPTIGIIDPQMQFHGVSGSQMQRDVRRRHGSDPPTIGIIDPQMQFHGVSEPSAAVVTQSGATAAVRVQL